MHHIISHCLGKLLELWISHPMLYHLTLLVLSVHVDDLHCYLEYPSVENAKMKIEQIKNSFCLGVLRDRQADLFFLLSSCLFTPIPPFPSALS